MIRCHAAGDRGSYATNALARDLIASTEARPDEVNTGEIAYLIAGDSPLRDTALKELTAAGINVRGFACVTEFLSCVRRDSAACIISDLQLADMTAVDLQRYTTQEGGPPTIFISAHPDMIWGIRAIKAGAVDFLIHPVEPAALIAAVDEAFKRDRAVRRRRANIAALEARRAQLTRREREVFALVVRGILNKQVAGMLAISLVTVQIHRGNVMRKMGARSFADLVCMAMKLQILEQDPGETENIGVFDGGAYPRRELAAAQLSRRVCE
jgi:FixJ family two-component response regulator